MARSLLLLAAFALFLTACKKTDETTSPEDTLRTGQWKRYSIKGSHKDAMGVVTVFDLYPGLPDCIKDNGLEFKENYVGTEHRNGACSAGDASEAKFQWEFYNSGQSIRIYNATETFQTSDIDADVITMSETQISMRYKAISQDPTQTVPTDTLIVTDVFRR